MLNWGYGTADFTCTTVRRRLSLQVFKLLVPHLADVAALNTVYRRHVLDPAHGLAEYLALGDRARGLCVKFISERVHSMTVQMLDQRHSFSKLGPYAAAIPGQWSVLSTCVVLSDVSAAEKDHVTTQNFGWPLPRPHLT